MNLPLLRLVVSQLPGWSYATGNAPKPLIWKIGLIEIASYECMLGRLQSEGNMKKTWDLFWQHTKMVWWAGLLNNWIISMCFSFVTLMLMVTSDWTCNWLESGWIFFWFEYVIKTHLYDINISIYYSMICELIFPVACIQEYSLVMMIIFEEAVLWFMANSTCLFVFLSHILSRQMLQQNFNRVKRCVLLLINMGSYINSCFQWESPRRSLCAFLVGGKTHTETNTDTHDSDSLIKDR